MLALAVMPPPAATSQYLICLGDSLAAPEIIRPPENHYNALIHHQYGRGFCHLRGYLEYSQPNRMIPEKSPISKLQYGLLLKKVGVFAKNFITVDA